MREQKRTQNDRTQDFRWRMLRKEGPFPVFCKRIYGSWFTIWNDRIQGGPLLPSASSKRMINVSPFYLHHFPLYKPNIYLLQHRLCKSKEVTLTKKETEKKNKTSLGLSYKCIPAFLQPGYHDKRYSVL